MEEKQFDPARQNTISPSPGLAAVNTHNPGEETETEKETDIVKTGSQEEAMERPGKTDEAKEGAD